MSLDKKYVLRDKGEAISLELDSFCEKQMYDVKTVYYKEDLIIVWTERIFKRAGWSKIVYLPFYYKDFIVDVLSIENPKLR